MQKVDLQNFTREELEGFVRSLGERSFRGRQIMRWIYQQGVEDFEEMTDIGKAFRRRLKEVAHISSLKPLAIETSPDGTSKFLFPLGDGNSVESVLIPHEGRLTLCISTQVGCRMGCRFCLTGLQGFARNLTAGEIVNQILAVRKATGRKRITNVVLMGMGEPLDNYEQVVKAIRVMEDEFGLGLSGRRITLSTVGLLPELERIFSEGIRFRLAISLNAADQGTRSRLMPISRRYPLEELLELCRRLPLPPRERITFEYVLIAGVNDSVKDAERLSQVLKGIRCKVNLIPYNEVPELPFRRPDPERVLAFQRVLLEAGYTVPLRESRGQEISAACGQLRGKVLKRRGSPQGTPPSAHPSGPG